MNVIAPWPRRSARPRGEASVGTWLSIGGWVCIAVTVIGLALSGIVWRKRGFRSGLRGIAWSLLPIAAYFTHSVRLIGQLVSAIVQFASSFVFSPKAWLGVGLLVASALLFLTSGGIPLVRRSRRRKDARRDTSGSDGPQPGKAPALQDRRARPAAEDDDLGDVRDILKRHGIS
jgi:hypothetical protein